MKLNIYADRYCSVSVIYFQQLRLAIISLMQRF